MANTSYIKNEVEPWVRNWLSKQFPGQSFKSQQLALTNIAKCGPGSHEFDEVSEDGTIVAAIKGHSYKTSGGKPPSGKYASLYQERYFLSLIKAHKKLLIFTNEDMYTAFLNKSRGMVADGIELVFCQLPEEMQRKVQKISEKASKEMSR
jgi:hypothetical protein